MNSSSPRSSSSSCGSAVRQLLTSSLSTASSCSNGSGSKASWEALCRAQAPSISRSACMQPRWHPASPLLPHLALSCLCQSHCVLACSLHTRRQRLMVQLLHSIRRAAHDVSQGRQQAWSLGRAGAQLAAQLSRQRRICNSSRGVVRRCISASMDVCVCNDKVLHAAPPC